MFHLALLQDYVRVPVRHLSRSIKAVVCEELLKKYANKVKTCVLC